MTLPTGGEVTNAVLSLSACTVPAQIWTQGTVHGFSPRGTIESCPRRPDLAEYLNAGTTDMAATYSPQLCSGGDCSSGERCK